MKRTPTKLPGIPKPPSGISPQLTKYLESISEALEIRLGRRGDPVDRAVTLRELITSGLAKELKASPFDPNNINSSNLGITADPPTNTTVPSAPTGFTAAGAYSVINLKWDAPFYGNHAHTELWSHSSDIIGDATLTSTVSGRAYVDPVGSDVTRYYWVRHVSTSDIHGPFNNSTGTAATTAPDVEHLLDVLTDSITSSELATELLTPINQITELDADITDINTDLSTITSGLSTITSDLSTITSNVSTLTSNQANFATTTQLNGYTTSTYLTSNYYTLNEVDSAITAEISDFNSNTLSADYTNTADLNTNYYTKTGADTAISAAITYFNTNTVGADYTNTADLTTNYYTKTSADSAIAAAITYFNTNTVGADYTNTADLTTNYYTKTGANSATAAAINTYNTNTIGANYTTTADLETNHYTKTDANAAIAEAITTLSSGFDDPDGGSSSVTLQQAMTTQATLNGTLKSSYAVKIDANGAIAGFGLSSTTNTLGVNESEFIVNADRFAIMRGGSDTTAPVVPFAVVPASTINGTAVPAGVYMDAAFIREASITAAKIGSVDADTITTGTLNVSDLIDANAISASQLNLVGTGTLINLKSAASGQRMEIKGDVIKVYDNNNQLRVVLGDLS